ncbi:MAG TPA: hypothetical protein PL152_06215, partial [Steroidobacteraceae bacterium]|nr:hypothetical protein [Steroidobacteraceae bacterium]
GKVPKDRDPKSLTLEECTAILAAAPERKGRWGKKTVAKAPSADAAQGAATDVAARPARKTAARKRASKSKATAAKTPKRKS